MPGRARWRGGGRARQRPGVLAGERWPCHLRCDARACTRAHARALHERCMHSDTLHARTARTRRRALAASSALPCACTHACACASHDALQCTAEKSNGPAAGSPLHAHQCLEGCSIHRTGSHRAKPPGQAGGAALANAGTGRRRLWRAARGPPGTADRCMVMQMKF